ncbi:MAG: hypothetical protein Kilf2KO_21670 [Rhodospirillales bacterium]
MTQETAALAGEESLGLMAFWASIEPDYFLRFQQWHNCEHMPERLSVPGFVAGRRYRALDGAPCVLMYYETETSGVLASKPYMAALNSPTPWTRESLRYFREPLRNIYARIGLAGAPGPFIAPYLVSLRFNLPQGDATRHAGDWLESLCRAPKIDRARLYRIDEETTGIVTSERKIYGGAPGAQRYLALVEMNLPFESDQDPLAAATREVFGDESGRRDETEDRLWLEMGYHRPDR